MLFFNAIMRLKWAKPNAMLLTSLYPKLGFQTYEEGPWCCSCTWIKVKCHLRIMRGCKGREEHDLGGYGEEA